MDIVKSGSSIIVNSKFQEASKLIPDESVDLVIADWPFNKGIVDATMSRLIADGLKQTHRILKPNGTIISVHYLEPNFHVWKEADYWGLNLGDSITMLRHPMKKMKDRLAYETLSILVFHRGELSKRTLNIARRSIGGNLIYSKEVWKVETDFWGDTRFRNGYWRKVSGDNVPEAMPESCVEKLLNIYCPSKGLVVDFFGGAGTIPTVCNKLGLRCISTEILPHRFQIIKRRLYQTNQELIAYSKDLLDKALEAINITGPYTKGDSQWQENKEKAVGSMQPERTSTLVGQVER